MSERPDGRDLLIIAREELIKGLLPKLPNELRYQTLMIANAMAIAAREFESGLDSDQRELTGLFQLLMDAKENVKCNPVADQEMTLLLQTYRRQLSAGIRSGEFDPATPAHQPMLQHLKITVCDKVAISNPKLLSDK